MPASRSVVVAAWIAITLARVQGQDADDCDLAASFAALNEDVNLYREPYDEAGFFMTGMLRLPAPVRRTRLQCAAYCDLTGSRAPVTILPLSESVIGDACPTLFPRGTEVRVDVSPPSSEGGMAQLSVSMSDIDGDPDFVSAKHRLVHGHNACVRLQLETEGHCEAFKLRLHTSFLPPWPTLAWRPEEGKRRWSSLLGEQQTEREHLLDPEQHRVARELAAVANDVTKTALAELATSHPKPKLPLLFQHLAAHRRRFLAMEAKMRNDRGLPPLSAACQRDVALPDALETATVPLPPVADRSGLGAMLQRDGEAHCHRLGVEVGSFRGGNADTLLVRWPSAWLLALVDPWKDQNEHSHYEDVLAVSRMPTVMETARNATARHAARAALWRATGDEAAAALVGVTQSSSLGVVDYVYLDARHDYTSVKADVEAWWPLLRAGGVLAGHDFLDAGMRGDGNAWEVQPDGRRTSKAVRSAVMECVETAVLATHDGEAYPSFYTRKERLGATP